MNRGHITDFKALLFLCRLLFTLGENDVSRGFADNDSRRADHRRHNDAEEKEGLAPSERLVCEKRVEERAENERGHTEAHKQTARAEAAAVGKPRVDRCDDDVISDSDAEPREDGVGDIERDNIALHKGGYDESAAREDSRRDEREICADQLCDTASEESADAESTHRQGEVKSKLCIAPAEFSGKRYLEDRPRVDDSREGEADGAERDVDPTQ